MSNLLLSVSLGHNRALELLRKSEMSRAFGQVGLRTDGISAPCLERPHPMARHLSQRQNPMEE